MSREWIDYPKDIEIQTKYGPVFLNVVQGDYVYVDGSSNGKFIEMHGNRYTISVRLQTPNGGKTWELSDGGSAVYSSIWRDFTFKKMPPSYKQKAIAEIVDRVTEYLAPRKNLLRQGAIANINNALLSEEEKLEELREQLKKQEAVVAVLNRQMEEVQKG